VAELCQNKDDGDNAASREHGRRFLKTGGESAAGEP